MKKLTNNFFEQVGYPNPDSLSNSEYSLYDKMKAELFVIMDGHGLDYDEQLERTEKLLEHFKNSVPGKTLESAWNKPAEHFPFYEQLKDLLEKGHAKSLSIVPPKNWVNTKEI